MQAFAHVPEEREKITSYKSMIETKNKESKKQFLKELAKGYLEAEKMKVMETFRMFEKEYESLENKDSFKAQYLESFIFELKTELHL
ncbi:MAG: hypothetical protein ACTSU4_01690 [Promethearchaeota archaeon]